MDPNRFLGTWKLVTSEFRRADGTVDYPFGRNAIGRIYYDAAGNMAVQIMRPDRPAFASEDMRMGTAPEVKAAFDGFVAYFGTHKVNHEDQTVTHHVHGSSFPNWVGTDQVRHFAFSGNRLTLSTPPYPMGGSLVTGVLIWERVT